MKNRRGSGMNLAQGDGCTPGIFWSVLTYPDELRYASVISVTFGGRISRQGKCNASVLRDTAMRHTQTNIGNHYSGVNSWCMMLSYKNSTRPSMCARNKMPKNGVVPVTQAGKFDPQANVLRGRTFRNYAMRRSLLPATAEHSSPLNKSPARIGTLSEPGRRHAQRNLQ